MYLSSDIDTINQPVPKNSHLSYTFHQGQFKNKTSSKRKTIYDVMRSFGSLLAFTLRFTYMAIAQMQGFSLSNSLIKKLYSAEDPNPHNKLENDLMTQAQEDDKEKIKREIETRETFSYKYSRFWVLWRFDKKICCCCRAKKKREDFLFKDAKGKLAEEIDLLEIVKKLRVHQFASQQILKPHQRDLVNFF